MLRDGTGRLSLASRLMLWYQLYAQGEASLLLYQVHDQLNHVCITARTSTLRRLQKRMYFDVIVGHDIIRQLVAAVQGYITGEIWLKTASVRSRNDYS